MPHFAGPERAKQLGAKKWGYDFFECVELLKEVIRVNSSGPVVLVIHDWGAFWGFFLQMKHPELVRAVVALDVGHPGMLRNPLQAFVAFTLFGLLYQWYLAISFLISKLVPVVGNKIGDALVRSFPFMVLGLKHPQGRSVSNRLNASMCYPYYYVYKLVLANLFGLNPALSHLLKSSKEDPSCPCLYVYGNKKLANFHSPMWIKAMKLRKDCAVKGLPCGHWVSLEAPNELNSAIDEWLPSALSASQSEDQNKHNRQ